MLTSPARICADALSSELSLAFERAFGISQAPLAQLVGTAAQIALECIANSDALYHNIEHTMLVTLVGLDILRGRTLLEATTPGDWAHFLVGCLMHDIGYVRGILNQDASHEYVTGSGDTKVTLARGASDAAMAPYHVDRSKLFVMERFGASPMLDAKRIAEAIEFTRFPAPGPVSEHELTAEAGLLRAADLIGQLGDPLYLRKANALYWEFEETGSNERLGYRTPADLVEKYPDFFWTSVSADLACALRYLKVTVSGRQWIASLHNNVFCAERDVSSSGPQR